MPYQESFIAPMREELTRLGVQKLRTAGDVDTEALGAPSQGVVVRPGVTPNDRQEGGDTVTSGDRIEQGLVDRLRLGERDAVDQLATEYGSKVYQLALRYLKNREDAEEVTQDVLLKVVTRIEAFRGDAALSSWIYRITFNSAMSRLRSSRAARQATVNAWTGENGGAPSRSSPDPIDWAPLADEEALRRELREAVGHALLTLPPLYRTPVILRDLEGLSTEQASRALRVKHQTLKSRLHRGRVMLRDRLTDFERGVTLHRPATVH